MAQQQVQKTRQTTSQRARQYAYDSQDRQSAEVVARARETVRRARAVLRDAEAFLAQVTD